MHVFAVGAYVVSFPQTLPERAREERSGDSGEDVVTMECNYGHVAYYVGMQLQGPLHLLSLT